MARLRLALWSAGITIVVLLILGTLLYVLVARQLAADGEAQLRARARQVAVSMATASASPDGEGVVHIVARGDAPGYVFGGPFSGTLAVILDDGRAVHDVGADDPDRTQAADGTIIDVSIPDEDDVGSLTRTPPFDVLGLREAREGLERLTVTDLGGTPVRVLSAPLDDGSGRAVIQVVGDISVETRTLEALLAMLVVVGVVVVGAAAAAGWVHAGRALLPVREALRRQRAFAADASHEMRTPLATIRGNLDLLGRGPPADVEARDALDDAVAASERLGALLDDLLFLARADDDAIASDAGAVDLADEVEAAVASLTVLARSRNVGIELDAAPTTVRGDAARLRQLAAILVDNAIRHGREGGHVTVEVTAPPGGARLRVSDDGSGIPAHEHALVFERFWRGHHGRTEGSGLGLAIARSIARAHGGRLTVGEGPDGGAAFQLDLPTT